jgi:polyisoprenoid-binding protein YceI
MRVMKEMRIAGIVVFIFCLCECYQLKAQRYRSSSSHVHFFSDAPMEDIEASNQDGKSVLDISTGEIVFSIPVKAFTFEKSLMQEHFNENYLESDIYPHATFKGKLSGFDPSIRTWQNARAEGLMNIHGVEQEISVDGRIRIGEDLAEIAAKFPIILNDYKIKIPKVVFYNIAEVVDVTITFEYEKIN